MPTNNPTEVDPYVYQARPGRGLEYALTHQPIFGPIFKLLGMDDQTQSVVLKRRKPGVEYGPVEKMSSLFGASTTPTGLPPI